MKSALITGANKGIGFETARQLLKKDYYVFLGSRVLEKGIQAVDVLKAQGYINVETVQIDVTDIDSVERARIDIGKKTSVLDVLINNAGINGGHPQTATKTNVETFKKVFETNIFGVIRVTQAFIDLLQNSPEARIVNVSTSLASLTLQSNPSWDFYNIKVPAYTSSKAALNMYTISLAYELRNMSLKINSVDPGYTDTTFTENKGTGTVETAALRIIKYATIDKDGPSGSFFSQEQNSNTEQIPW